MSQKLKGSLMVIGTMLLAFAIALFRHSGSGADPFSTLNLGVSNTFNITFGMTQVVVNALLFIPVWKYARELIGVGTIINMLTVGYLADFFYFLLDPMMPSAQTVTLRLILTGIAVLVACLGIALYIESHLGIAPYDAASLVIVEVSKQKIPFFLARILVDGLAVIIGFALGSTLGVATVLMAFLAGPIIQFFREGLLQSRFTLQAKETEIS
jgi:uncharacterized membrane protein YczE